MSADRGNPQSRVAEHHRSGQGNVRIPYPIGARAVEVAAREFVTPRMLRLTLSGPELDGFHTYQADDHVRIVFADPDGVRRDPVPNDEQMLDWPRPFPPTRKYTIRRFDVDRNELDLDVVLHEGGLASNWASSVRLGDEVMIAGPPGAKAFPHTYDHYVFAIDSTGLPATARWLDESPSDVSAQIVIDTDGVEEHAYPLATRDGVEVRWLLREGVRSSLAATVAGLELPTGRVFLFAAGEATDIKPLRSWAKGRVDSLFTGYWKRGVVDLED